MSSDEICGGAKLELIKHPLEEKVLNVQQRLIMDVVQCLVGKKGRDGWEWGREKVQVGYTLLTCGPPLVVPFCTAYCVDLDYLALKA